MDRRIIQGGIVVGEILVGGISVGGMSVSVGHNDFCVQKMKNEGFL